MNSAAKIIFLVLALAGVAAYIVFGILDAELPESISNLTATPREFAEVSTRDPLDYAAHNAPLFYGTENSRGFFCVTKDGERFIDEFGETKNRHMYANMTAPTLRGEGDYIAVGERGGLNLYVFNDGGLTVDIPLGFPLTAFTVNRRGDTCAVTRRDDGYVISVFTVNGTLIHEVGYAKANVFPASVALSPDGRFLAVVFYDINGIEAESEIMFYLTDKKETAAKNVKDGVWGAFGEFGGETALGARFASDNRLVVFTDKAVLGVEIEPKLRLAWREELFNAVGGVFVAPDFVAVLYGEANVGARVDGVVARGTVRILAASDGVQKGLIEPDGEPDFITGGENTLIVAYPDVVKAFKFADGTELWGYETPVKAFGVTLASNSKIVLTCETRAYVLSREKVGK